MGRAGIVAVFLALPSATLAAQPEVPMGREIEVEGHKVYIDSTPAVIRIDVEMEFEDSPALAELARGLHKSHADAYEAAQKLNADVLPSVSLVLAKCKKFDDGMYAAVELAAEEGLGKLPGKREFLNDLIRALDEAPVTSEFGEKAATTAVSLIYGAMNNAYTPPKPGYSLGPKPKRLDEGIAGGATGRKPVGFYMWKKALEVIFRRDTALQTRIKVEEPETLAVAALIVRTMESNPPLLEHHAAITGLYARLTNKLTRLSPQGVKSIAAKAGGLDAVINDADAAAQAAASAAQDAPAFSILPPSEARENEVIGTTGMDGFVEAVKSGEIDLEPDEDSGWYQYQQYSLAPLILPDDTDESEKMELSEEYRELLESQFKSTMSQVRETHAKQVEMAMGAAPPSLEVTITPHLSVEPWPTVYYRYNQSYRFLGTQLRRQVGQEVQDLHALNEGGVEREATLGAELANLWKLLLGVELLAHRDLGLPLGREWLYDTGPEWPYMRFAEDWLQNWHTDPDMARDVRMMIQVATMPNRYWCVVGVHLVRVRVSFVTPPKVEGDVEPIFEDAWYWLPIEQFIEVTDLGEPLNREEFRALCDKAQTAEGILNALKQEGATAEPMMGLSGEPVSVADKGISPAMLVFGIIILMLVIAVAIRIARGATGR